MCVFIDQENEIYLVYHSKLKEEKKYKNSNEVFEKNIIALINQQYYVGVLEYVLFQMSNCDVHCKMLLCLQTQHRKL